MSRFTKDLRVIPRTAWVVAWIFYACFTVPLFFFVLPTDPDIGTWPRWGQALFIYGFFLVEVAYVALIGYVYGDAKRRQMRYEMWTLLSTFIPLGIGIMLYFILRDPLWKPCPSCENVVKGLPFCPHCGTSLEPTCPNCSKTVVPAWANCGHCGQRLHVPGTRATQDRGLAT